MNSVANTVKKDIPKDEYKEAEDTARIIDQLEEDEIQ